VLSLDADNYSINLENFQPTGRSIVPLSLQPSEERILEDIGVHDEMMMALWS
jgi:hypothetical protein